MIFSRVRKMHLFAQNVPKCCVSVNTFERCCRILRNINGKNPSTVPIRTVYELHTSISKIKIPSVHQSTVLQWWFPRMISGARYSVWTNYKHWAHYFQHPCCKKYIPSVPTNELAFNLEIQDFVSRLGDYYQDKKLVIFSSSLTSLIFATYRVEKWRFDDYWFRSRSFWAQIEISQHDMSTFMQQDVYYEMF